MSVVVTSIAAMPTAIRYDTNPLTFQYTPRFWCDRTFTRSSISPRPAMTRMPRMMIRVWSEKTTPARTWLSRYPVSAAARMTRPPMVGVPALCACGGTRSLAAFCWRIGWLAPRSASTPIATRVPNSASTAASALAIVSAITRKRPIAQRHTHGSPSAVARAQRPLCRPKPLPGRGRTPYGRTMEIEELNERATEMVRSATLSYDQKLRRLAVLATDVLPYPALSEECREALDKRVICDLFEGNAPYTPRYVLPDYEKAIQQGLAYLELPPPTSLDDALAFLQIMYAHVPSVTTYPVYLGDLDKVLAPFVDDTISDADLDTKLRRFWIGIDRMLPDAFVHLDLGPADSRIVRSIFRVERSLRQAVPNITLKVDPDLTPDSLIEDGVRTVFETGQAALREPSDDGRRSRRTLCRGQLLQLAQDRGWRPHARPTQLEGSGIAPRRRRGRVPEDDAAALRGVDGRVGRGSGSLSGRGAALLRNPLACHRRSRVDSIASRRCSVCSVWLSA